jgi:hypothetical protein
MENDHQHNQVDLTLAMSSLFVYKISKNSSLLSLSFSINYLFITFNKAPKINTFTEQNVSYFRPCRRTRWSKQVCTLCFIFLLRCA